MGRFSQPTGFADNVEMCGDEDVGASVSIGSGSKLEPVFEK